MSGIAIGVWVSSGISGGHINPAVCGAYFHFDSILKYCMQITLALATWRGFPWKKVPGSFVFFSYEL